MERCTEAVLDQVAGGMDRAAIVEALDPLVRIRAVQDMPPSAAVGFVLDLRDAVRGELGGEASAGDLAEIDRRVDEVALAAFDLYMTCRQKVYEIKATELRHRSMAALERFGLLDDDPAAGEAPAGDPHGGTG